MEDLTTFFTDRLDELEFGAKHRSAHHVGCATMTGGAIVYSEPATCDCRVSEYLLADIEAKRKLLALHAHEPISQRRRDADDESFGCVTCHFDHDYEQTYGGGWCQHVRLLASPFAWHPDYREEDWKP